MVSLIVIILGLVALMKLPVDMMPDVTFPAVTVSATYQDASPEDVEELVTRPIEEGVSAVPGVKEIRSWMWSPLPVCEEDFRGFAAKHGLFFMPPNDGSEVNRTGVATFMTEQKAREGELRAMQASIEDAKALGAMTAYNRVGVYTDNAHPTLLKNIVRGEWGFQGLMSEDFIMDPSYVTLKEAVLNGVTMSCNTGESTMAAVSGYYPYWTLENVQNDPELTAALKQAMTWQAYALANSNAMDGYASSTRIEKVRTWYDNALTGVAIVFALLTLLNIVMYFKARKKED